MTCATGGGCDEEGQSAGRRADRHAARDAGALVDPGVRPPPARLQVGKTHCAAPPRAQVGFRPGEAPAAVLLEEHGMDQDWCNPLYWSFDDDEMQPTVGEDHALDQAGGVTVFDPAETPTAPRKRGLLFHADPSA